MNRLSAALVALAVACAPSPNAAASDYDCPPGAKFCPAPGLSGGSGGGSYGGSSFGMPPPPMASAGAAQSHFESQLNEGEQLIMVAPNERNGIIITPNPAAYADSGFSGNGYASGFDSYSGGDSYSSGTYSGDTYSMDSYSTGDTYSSGVYSSEPTVYSASPVYAGDTYSLDSYSTGTYSSGGFTDSNFGDNNFGGSGFADSGSGGGMGGMYIPPPPGGGFQPAQPMQPQPMQPVMQQAFSPMESEPLAMQPADNGRNYRQKNSARRADMQEADQTPKTFRRDYHNAGNAVSKDYDEYSETSRPTATVRTARNKPDTIPSREDVARSRSSGQRYSPDGEQPEAAYGGKRRGGYSPASYADGGGSVQEKDSRVPWWKGGMWRNRKADRAERDAAKAEAQARNKAQAKAGARHDFRNW